MKYIDLKKSLETDFKDYLDQTVLVADANQPFAGNDSNDIKANVWTGGNGRDVRTYRFIWERLNKLYEEQWMGLQFFPNPKLNFTAVLESNTETTPDGGEITWFWAIAGFVDAPVSQIQSLSPVVSPKGRRRFLVVGLESSDASFKRPKFDLKNFGVK